MTPVANMVRERNGDLIYEICSNWGIGSISAGLAKNDKYKLYIPQFRADRLTKEQVHIPKKADHKEVGDVQAEEQSWPHEFLLALRNLSRVSVKRFDTVLTQLKKEANQRQSPVRPKINSTLAPPRLNHDVQSITREDAVAVQPMWSTNNLPKLAPHQLATEPLRRSQRRKEVQDAPTEGMGQHTMPQGSNARPSTTWKTSDSRVEQQVVSRRRVAVSSALTPTGPVDGQLPLDTSVNSLFDEIEGGPPVDAAQNIHSTIPPENIHTTGERDGQVTSNQPESRVPNSRPGRSTRTARSDLNASIGTMAVQRRHEGHPELQSLPREENDEVELMLERAGEMSIDGSNKRTREGGASEARNAKRLQRLVDEEDEEDFGPLGSHMGDLAQRYAPITRRFAFHEDYELDFARDIARQREVEAQQRCIQLEAEYEIARRQNQD